MLLARRVDLQRAMHLYDLALARGADVLDVAGDQWHCAMLLGDFEAAWRVSDAVMAERKRRKPSCADQPYHLRWVWDGQPLEGKHVLVRCYHGLGDVVQFIRFMAPLRAIASRVTAQCVCGLLPVVAAVEGIDSVIPLESGTHEPPFDVEVELMEVPYALRITLATIPTRVPYLAVAPGRVAARRRKLGGSGLKIGIVWAAGGWRPERSVPLPLLFRLAGQPGIDLVNLQRGAPLAELDASDRSPLLEWGSRTDDLAETAVTLAALDLVISVDTMIAHLAGALGVPVWTLLHHDSDWRWMIGRTDSPWYPKMRLFRQRSAGDWTSVIDDVVAALRDGQATFR